MSLVTELGYLGISVSDADAWKQCATEVIGLQLLDAGEADRFYLRADEWHHRFVVHTDGGDDYRYSGWRVAGRPELEEIARRLDAVGVEYAFGDAAAAEERRVLGLIKLKDLAGNPIELFYGPEICGKEPFHPGRPMFGRFRTGTQGLGHCLLHQPDMQGGLDFYRLLGFVGDVEFKMMVNGQRAEAAFMHINDRQHSLAFGGGDTGKRINHLMLEYTDIRDLGISHDIVQKREFLVPMNLGMHSNDKMLSFYFVNPSSWAIELGWNGAPPPVQQEYYARDVFGHANTAAGFGLDLDASDV